MRQRFEQQINLRTVAMIPAEVWNAYEKLIDAGFNEHKLGTKA